MRLGVIGDGRAARALLPRWLQAGHVLAWQQRRGEATPLAAREAAEVVILAVRDGDLSGVARELGARPAASAEIWLHLSGALSGGVLRQSAEVPGACGGLHPLVALTGAPAVGGQPLAGVAGLDGEPEAVAAARILAADLGLTPVTLAADGPEAKARYHAAAVTVAGHVTALFSQGLGLMVRAGLSPGDARAALLPLIASAVRNLEAGPPEAVITGPIARGDARTVARHLAALADGPADTLLAYRALACEALRLSGPALPSEVVAELAGLLSG